jgi:hypothetical protein
MITKSRWWLPASALALLLYLAAGDAQAILPKPVLTPGQQQAADQKKRDAAALAEQEKQKLAASMESVATRWRSRAKENGWTAYPPVAIAAPAPSPAAAPVSAAASVHAAQSTSASASAPASPSQPAPLRSEKLGTAPASEDVKNPARKGK